MAPELNAFNIAMARAALGLDWSYPCLIWVMDYVRDETGVDYAANWRGIQWTKSRAMREMAKVADDGGGLTLVDKALDATALRHGWPEREGGQQGAVMVGCYTSSDIGIPAIYDGHGRWLLCGTGAAMVTRAEPDRVWEVPRCAA